jgi:hypothetical protein
MKKSTKAAPGLLSTPDPLRPLRLCEIKFAGILLKFMMLRIGDCHLLRMKAKPFESVTVTFSSGIFPMVTVIFF